MGNEFQSVIFDLVLQKFKSTKSYSSKYYCYPCISHHFRTNSQITIIRSFTARVRIVFRRIYSNAIHMECVCAIWFHHILTSGCSLYLGIYIRFSNSWMLYQISGNRSVGCFVAGRPSIDELWLLSANSWCVSMSLHFDSGEWFLWLYAKWLQCKGECKCNAMNTVQQMCAALRLPEHFIKSTSLLSSLHNFNNKCTLISTSAFSSIRPSV